MTVLTVLLAGAIYLAWVAGAGLASVPIELGRASMRATLGGTTLEPQRLSPGSEFAALLQLANDGDTRWESLTLEVEAPTRSALVTSRRDGLQIRVDACAKGWDISGNRSRPTCRGATRSVVSTRPVLDGTRTLTGLRSAAPGGRDQLLVTISLPRRAGNDMQGRAASLDVVVRADQSA